LHIGPAARHGRATPDRNDVRGGGADVDEQAVGALSSDYVRRGGPVRRRHRQRLPAGLCRSAPPCVHAPTPDARVRKGGPDCVKWVLADLDALAGGAMQSARWEVLAGLRGRLLVDAAVTTPERARELVAAGAARVVVGLETLQSFDALTAVVRAIGPSGVA